MLALVDLTGGMTSLYELCPAAYIDSSAKNMCLYIPPNTLHASSKITYFAFMSTRAVSNATYDEVNVVMDVHSVL